MATNAWSGRTSRSGRWVRALAMALVAATVILGSALSLASPAATQVVFGPEDFVRTTARSRDVKRTFRVASADGPFTLCVDNGGARDKFPFVSRGEVELNDRYEIEARDFSARPPFISRAVRVKPGLNTLEVEIESARGTGFTVSVVRGNADACPGAGGGANRPPSITTSAVTSAVAGQAYTYDVNATDADNDPLTYALTTSPSGMTIAAGTGVISWTPGVAGTFPVLVGVSDGRGGSATQSFSIVVPQPNRVPTFTSSPATTGTVNQAYAYDADATDADNDPLTYALTTSPSGMTIAAGTGVIAWTPSAAGTFPVIVEVSDGRGGSATQSFSVVVPQPNRAPTFTSNPVTAGTVNQAYAYDADATDADNDPLTYALTTSPSGMTIAAGTGVIAWTPSAAGTFSVVVTASDGRGGSATQSFAIVVPQPATNRPPTAADDHYVVPVGQTMTVPAPGVLNNDSDPDGDPVTASLLPGSEPDKGTLSGPNPDGSFTYAAPSGPTGPAFQSVVRYRAQMNGAYYGHYEVDVTGDGVRDVLVKSGNGFGAFDGPTGAPLWLIGTGIGSPALPPQYTQPCRVNSGLEGWAVGDIDDDGVPEVVTTANCDPSVYDYDDHLMAFDARTGAEKWVSQRLSVTRNPAAPGVGFTYTNPGAAWAAGVTIARLTPNDAPVILFGNSRNANDCSLYVEQAPDGVVDCRRVTIVDGPTGAKRRTMYSVGAAINNRAANADVNETQNFQPPIVFDLDRDGDVEIVYAGVVFALDGSPKWELPLGTPHIAIGNLDDTPDVEIVTITRLAPTGRLGNLEAYKSDGTLLWRYPLGNGNTNLFSNLTVADTDGDGFADVLFPYYDYGLAIDMLLAVGHDGRLKWLTAGPATSPGAAVSARSRVAVFDLDGDGLPEVIKQHPDALHFLNGVDGSVKASVPFGQLGDLGGSMFVPSVADLDGDGRAEVVAVNAGVFHPDYAVWVIKSARDDWRHVTGGLSQTSSGGAAVSVSGRVPLDYGNPFADRRTNVFGTVAPEPLPSNRTTANQTSFFYAVNDGTLSSLAKVTIDIAPRNRPPTFTSTPPQVYTPFSGLSYAALAVDPDAGDTVTYRIGAIYDQSSVATGNGCAIGAGTGLLTCVFMDYNTGKDPLVQFLLIATDDHGASSSQLVSVVPSTGAPRVPNVIGQTQAAAVSAVIAAGLQVWAVMPVPSGFPAGQVTSQTPAGGTVLPAGGLVSLVVSAGPPPVVVPNVVGRPQVVANSTLLSEKLKIGTVTFALSTTVADGGIVSQFPAAGTSVPRQTAVDLVVSLGSGVRVTLERSVIASGSAVAITGHVLDASGTAILPTPTLAFVILGTPAAGTPPTVSGATIVTSADTRGTFALRAMLPSSGAYAEASFTVIPGATSVVHSRLSEFSATLGATERRFARIGELITANDLVAVAAEAAALRATRTALDLETIRTTPVAAPEDGFLPELSEVVAAGFSQTSADEAWLRGLSEISDLAERLEGVLKSDSPTRSEVVELQMLAGQLHTAVEQLQQLQPTAFGLVAGAGELHEGAAVRIPQLLAAALDRSVSLLQRQGLSASLMTPEAMFDGHMTPLIGTPASYYGLARPTIWGGTLGELVPVMSVLSTVIKTAGAAAVLYYGLDHAWRSIGLALNPQVNPNMLLEVQGGSTFPAFGYSKLRASVGSQVNNHPGQYDVLVIGSSAVSAVQNLLAASLGNVRNDSELTALLDQVKTLARNAGAWQNANARPTTVTPDGFGANGCIGNLYCVALDFTGGITKVNTGLSLLPQPVYIIVRNLSGDRKLAHGLFAFW